MKKLLKDTKGTTLFEALTGIAILTIVGLMLLGGFITAQKLMGYGDDIQDNLVANQSNVETFETPPTSTNSKTLTVFVGGNQIVMDGEIRIYEENSNESATIGVFVNK